MKRLLLRGFTVVGVMLGTSACSEDSSFVENVGTSSTADSDASSAKPGADSDKTKNADVSAGGQGDGPGTGGGDGGGSGGGNDGGSGGGGDGGGSGGGGNGGGSGGGGSNSGGSNGASPIIVPGDKTPACVQGPAVNIDATVSIHQDVRAGARNRYKGSISATSDMASSAVARLPLNLIRGNVLPVSQFGLDDVAIIVKESETISSVLSTVGGTRLVKIPDSALMIYDGNNVNFSDGGVDSDDTTIYQFDTRYVSLPGGRSIKLKDVYAMGVPLIAHNAVNIDELISRGYQVGNELRFKVFHVAHGSGYVVLNYKLSTCP